MRKMGLRMVKRGNWWVERRMKEVMMGMRRRVRGWLWGRRLRGERRVGWLSVWDGFGGWGGVSLRLFGFNSNNALQLPHPRTKPPTISLHQKGRILGAKQTLTSTKRKKNQSIAGVFMTARFIYLHSMENRVRKGMGGWLFCVLRFYESGWEVMGLKMGWIGSGEDRVGSVNRWGFKKRENGAGRGWRKNEDIWEDLWEGLFNGMIMELWDIRLACIQ